MRLPQVSERIKEAPAQALRGVFAGIGQLLLITDKLRNKTPAGEQVPRAHIPGPSVAAQDPGPLAAPVPAPPGAPTPSASPLPPADPVPAPPPEPAPSADPAPAPPADPVVETRDLDRTGNVRLLSGEKAGAGDPAPAVDTMTAEGAAVAEEVGPVAETTASAPLPNYDQLSVPSLRARLRNLNVAQLRQLLVYEQAHAARPDVIAMFERRITKLEGEGMDERGEASVEAEAEAEEDVEADVEAEEAEAVADES